MATIDTRTMEDTGDARRDQLPLNPLPSLTMGMDPMAMDTDTPTMDTTGDRQCRAVIG